MKSSHKADILNSIERDYLDTVDEKGDGTLYSQEDIDALEAKCASLGINTLGCLGGKDLEKAIKNHSK